MLTKVCAHCRCDLPLAEFFFDPKAKPSGKSKGVTSVCRFCTAIKRKAWKKANPEKAKQHRKDRKRRQAQQRMEKRLLIGPTVPLRISDPIAFKARRRWGRRAYKSKLKCAKPRWFEKSDVNMWYEVAAALSRGGVRFEVDHVVPLRSSKVCGLHSQHNLQILPAHLSAAKGNRHWPDMP